MTPPDRVHWRDRGLLLFAAAATLGPVASMALRFVPAELERTGHTPLLIGQVMAASTLGGLLLLPLAGRLARARLRPLLTAGALLQALGLALAAAATLAAVPLVAAPAPTAAHVPPQGAPDPILLALGVAIASAGMSMIDVGIATAAVALVAAPARPQVLAYAFVLLNLARNVVGSALAEALYLAASFRAMCLALALLALLHALLRLRLPLPAALAIAPAAPPPPIAADLRHPRLLLLLLVFVLLGVHHVAQESFLSALTTERRIATVTPVFTAYALVVLIGRVLAGHRVDRIGRGPIVITSALLLAAVGVGLALAHTLPLLIALGALTGLAHTLLWPALYATFYDKVRDHGALSALLTALLALAGLLAELALGRLALDAGYAAIYLTVAAAALLAALLTAPLARWMSPAPPPPLAEPPTPP